MDATFNCSSTLFPQFFMISLFLGNIKRRPVAYVHMPDKTQVKFVHVFSPVFRHAEAWKQSGGESITRKDYFNCVSAPISWNSDSIQKPLSLTNLQFQLYFGPL